MPTLNWIGRKAVENHHRQVPFHLLKDVPVLSVGDPGAGNLLVYGDDRPHVPFVGTSERGGAMRQAFQSSMCFAIALPDKQADLRRPQYKADARPAVFTPVLLVKTIRGEL